MMMTMKKTTIRVIVMRYNSDIWIKRIINALLFPFTGNRCEKMIYLYNLLSKLNLYEKSFCYPVTMNEKFRVQELNTVSCRSLK